MRYLKEVLSARELLANLTLREIRGKYKRTIFGQLWSLANPLALMLIYTFVFGFIFRIQPDPGDPSGLERLRAVAALRPAAVDLPRQRDQQRRRARSSTTPSLIQKVYFPRIVLPLSIVGSIGLQLAVRDGRAARRALDRAAPSCCRGSR